ncbi:MAG TPA: DUF2254 domain-containing protein [Chloroflexota bacterium]|nr:DUF2254 domain-containing protein [Chloroflexota bacterium]
MQSRQRNLHPLPRPQPARGRGSLLVPLSRSSREAIRTNLWALPSFMVVLIVGLFAVTYGIDAQAAAGVLVLPAWLSSGGPDVARQILIAIATAVITVAGVVFSITILVLQLASQQFGPRMLRNFIRDLGTQASLGAFVATFVYSVLALQVVTDPPQSFVPHLSTSVAVALVLLDLGVLIYFIDHVASSIQLTSVVSDIAQDFRTTLAQLQADEWQLVQRGAAADDLVAVARTADMGDSIAAQESGFLQAVGYKRLVAIATQSDAVIRLLHRPGHFVVAGQPLARVIPPSAVGVVSRALVRTHLVGPNRTLTQDPGFAIDQLVEVALRALSPAVNDTFTALNCIDWLGDCLCHAYSQRLPSGIYCDAYGTVRVIEPVITYERLLKGATDKIRQAGRGMPAILIRQLESLQKVMTLVATPVQREALLHHARILLRASEESVSEESDQRDVQAAFDLLLAITSDLWDG